MVRELNFGDKKQEMLSKSDFTDVRIVKLKSIQVINRKFFENAKAKDLKKL